MPGDDLVGLADAIEGLRETLGDAMNRGEASSFRFTVDPIELTVQAVVTKDANAKIGWKLIGVGASYESAVTQTVTLRLTPLWKTASGELTRDFTVASVSPEDDTIA
jgi:hypothetical protein